MKDSVKWINNDINVKNKSIHIIDNKLMPMVKRSPLIID
jgi:hypothetical protein